MSEIGVGFALNAEGVLVLESWRVKASKAAEERELECKRAEVLRRGDWSVAK